MKQLIINDKNPNGKIIEVNVSADVENKPSDPIIAFFEGLASADTNSIAKIRALAKVFLENTEEV